MTSFAIGTIVLDQGGLDELLTSVDGPVGRDLQRRGVVGESAAKQNASGRPGPNVQTGRLRSSIRWVVGHDGAGLYLDVGSDVEYAGYVEEGTDRAPAYPYLEPALPAMLY